MTRCLCRSSLAFGEAGIAVNLRRKSGRKLPSWDGLGRYQGLGRHSGRLTMSYVQRTAYGFSLRRTFGILQGQFPFGKPPTDCLYGTHKDTFRYTFQV